ncbi:MAG: phosphate acyltransferase PlsX [Campylobacteraceae bacterium]|nr:phosphate acyltransferase PlsX [Campylobacteraceae bacterium]
MIKIAIDAMGGDFGCEPIVKGVMEALKEKEFEAFLVGDESKINPFIESAFKERVTIIPASEIVEMSDHATDALKKRESSIYKAIDLVREGKCDAVVSAGHSGATMSLATLRIGRLEGISRPAIATLMPNTKGFKTLVLDVGANVDCKAEHLFQFGVMGEIYAKTIMNITNPTVGILSNGEEESKGDEVTKGAFNLLKALDSFVGNVEGNQIFDGSVNVVTCDGFVGNIVLKTSEGAASAIGKILKSEIKKSPLSMLGAMLMKNSFKNLKKATDYDEYGGAPLLGVKKCVIISHGKSSPKAIKNALFQALKFANSDINSSIVDTLKTMQIKG